MTTTILLALIMVLVIYMIVKTEGYCPKEQNCTCPDANYYESFSPLGPRGSRPCMRKTEEELALAMTGGPASNVGMEYRDF
jgi:hypothetical protein